MFQISAYTIFTTDTPEVGRTKINYLFSGGASPFSIWSGITDDTKYISVLKQDENNSNTITSLIGAESAYTNYNLIFNGSNNTIDQFKTTDNESGSYNLINGLDNSIDVGYSGNTSTGSGNTISSSENSFIHGVKNEINPVSLSSNLTILSSYNTIINGDVLFSNAFSSKESKISKNTLISNEPTGNTIVGINNIIESGNNDLKYSFILNGQNNLIESNTTNIYDFSGIINGQNNNIDITNSINNTYIFGSNIDANSKNSSHFENLYVDETLLSTKVKKYTINSVPTQNITIDLEQSFHEIYNVNQPNVGIYIPDSTNDLQVLSICISGGTSPTPLLTFYDSSFSSFPTNISCKPGTVLRYTTGGPDAGTAVAYFFMWTSKINKWVMFTSDTDSTANF